MEKLQGVIDDSRPQYSGAERAYEALLRVSPDWRAYERALELLY